MSENPDNMACASELQALDLDRLGPQLEKFKFTQEHTPESDLFKQVDDQTTERIKKALEPSVQESPGLITYGTPNNGTLMTQTADNAGCHTGQERECL